MYCVHCGYWLTIHHTGQRIATTSESWMFTGLSFQWCKWLASLCNAKTWMFWVYRRIPRGICDHIMLEYVRCGKHDQFCFCNLHPVHLGGVIEDNFVIHTECTGLSLILSHCGLPGRVRVTGAMPWLYILPCLFRFIRFSRTYETLFC